MDDAQPVKEGAVNAFFSCLSIQMYLLACPGRVGKILYQIMSWSESMEEFLVSETSHKRKMVGFEI